MQTATNQIGPQELNARIVRGEPVKLLDVRTLAEFADGHAQGAISIPADQVDAQTVQLRLGKPAGRSQTLYLLCASGVRALQASRKLEAQGLENVAVVEGGTEAWAGQQLPMVRNTRSISLERQTQIALGILLILVLVKGTLLHPLFYALIGVLGGGLIVAGVTARCGLSALLARMPWNRAPAMDATG